MTQFISQNNTIGSKTIITYPILKTPFTVGVFDEDLNIVEKVSLRNNLSEKEAIKLIDEIRDKLPMNQ